MKRTEVPYDNCILTNSDVVRIRADVARLGVHIRRPVLARMWGVAEDRLRQVAKGINVKGKT